MPVIVRIAIHDNNVMGGAKKDKIFFVFFFFKNRTKKTAGRSSGTRTQIRRAPRCPHSVDNLL